MAFRQSAEIMEADGTNVHATFKAIGFVNGLEHFKNILSEKLEYYTQNTKEEYVEAITKS